MLEHYSPKAPVFSRLAVMLAAALSSSFLAVGGWPETLYQTWPSTPLTHVIYIRGPFWEFLRRSDVLLGKVKSRRGKCSSSLLLAPMQHALLMLLCLF